MRRLPLGPMEAFVVVARCGSLAHAASAMNLTVPALSRRIQLLEAHLGVQLFQRQPRGLALTPEGAAYFEALAPAYDRIHQATESARARKRRTITVSLMPTFAANWLVPRLGLFHERHRDVEVELHTSADIIDLQSRPDLDCAVRLGKGPWPGVACEPILPVHAFPVASPEFIGTMCIQHPRDLAGHALIGTHHQPEFWREWFAAVSVNSTAADYRAFDNLQVVYEAAAAGMGIALGLDPVVRPYLDRGRLVRLFPSEVRLPRQFHLVRRHHGNRSDRALSQFRDWLVSEANAFRAAPDTLSVARG